MSFSTLLFVAGFLPSFFILYMVVPGVERKNRILLLFSLLFYVFVGIPYLLLLLAVTAVVYFIGRGFGEELLSDIVLKSEGQENGEEPWNGGSWEANSEARRGDPALGEFQASDKDETSGKTGISDRSEKKGKSRISDEWRLGLGIAMVLMVLLFFKYVNPVASLMKESGILNEHFRSIALPLGISFYSFKLISYLIERYRRTISPKSYGELLLYVLMFPEVSQGPITRFSEIEREMRERRQSWEDVSEGLFRFMVGLGKKTLLADHAGRLAEQILPVDFLTNGSGISGISAYLAALFYMLQLYLDFSAYSDMAIGLGRMCGFHFPENFNYPYMASSVRDFWRRWHISLSAFFRDYVYIPLGGNRVSFQRLLLNLLAVWLLTGIWHGSSLNFLLWGLYYFFFIVMENLFVKWKKRENRKSKDKVEAGFDEKGFIVKQENVVVKASEKQEERPAAKILGSWQTVAKKILSHGYTLLVVYFGWVLFRFSDFHALKEVLKTMLGLGETGLWDSFSLLTLKNNIFFLLVCLIAVTPLMKILGERQRSSMRRAQDIRRKKLLRREQQELGESFGDESLREFSQLNEEEGEGVGEEDGHSLAYRRLQRRIRSRRRAAGRAEALYYLERGIIALGLLGLAVMAMVGNSYVPFLYNQF